MQLIPINENDLMSILFYLSKENNMPKATKDIAYWHGFDVEYTMAHILFLVMQESVAVHSFGYKYINAESMYWQLTGTTNYN